MSKKKTGTARSVHQLVGNAARERGIDRDDAFVGYAIDRFLYRLGRSAQADEFSLKGGVLVANLVADPFRFSRDLDTLRRHGPPDPGDIRERIRQIAAIENEDGLTFGRVRAVAAERATDDYDGVKVTVEATVEGQSVDLRIDVGFGDAVEPPVHRVQIAPFLRDDQPAVVQAYGAGSVVSEKVQTVVSKFPFISHRLKDILDVVVIADRLDFDGKLLVSMRATFERRGTRSDPKVLDDLGKALRGRKWEGDWASMLKDKLVRRQPTLADAVRRFDEFVRPLLLALRDGTPGPGAWPPGGPWTSPTPRAGR